VNEVLRVLIVEDDFLVGEKLRGILESLGHVVVGEAADGGEAVELTRTLKPDIVMMDVHLPTLDGIAAARRIAETCPTPVVALTAYESTDLIAGAGEAGIGYYLVKPATAQEIERSLNIAVARFEDLKKLRRLNTQLQAEIAERKRMEQELARSNADLEAFAYTVSHDLQEPLRMVSSFMTLLKKEYYKELNDEAQTYIVYAMDGATRMSNMIQALLEHARISTRGQPFALTDCEALLAQVLRDLQPQIVETNAVISHDPLPEVMADAMQLGRVFQNLISNALKFQWKTGPGQSAQGEGAHTHQPRVHISAQLKEVGTAEWRFCVKDNGIGIPPAHTQHIFQVFKRLHTREEYEGTGIGLANCKKIVERHGGRIWVESNPAEGCTFYFTLPQHPHTPT